MKVRKTACAKIFVDDRLLLREQRGNAEHVGRGSEGATLGELGCKKHDEWSAKMRQLHVH